MASSSIFSLLSVSFFNIYSPYISVRHLFVRRVHRRVICGRKHASRRRRQPARRRQILYDPQQQEVRARVATTQRLVDRTHKGKHCTVFASGKHSVGARTTITRENSPTHAVPTQTHATNHSSSPKHHRRVQTSSFDPLFCDAKRGVDGSCGTELVDWRVHPIYYDIAAVGGVPP